MIKISGLYKSTSKKGEAFLSGKSMDGVKYFVFKNHKKKDSHPDYNLYMEDIEDKSSTPKAAATEDYSTQSNTDDDIPF